GPAREGARRRSRSGTSAGASRRRSGRWLAIRASPATETRSATAPPRWACTSCGGCCVAKTPPSRGPRARMFVALDLPEPARTRIADWRDELVAGRRDLRPLAREALHVTLAFLAWQDESTAEAIAQAAFQA